MDIRRIAYGLIQAGLVEIVRMSGGPQPTKHKMSPTENVVEQKSLINKLIGRIRTI